MRKTPGILTLLLLAGCGGGGGGRDDGGSAYLVSAFDRTGREVRVCIDGIDPPNPASAAGQDTTASLMEYFQLGGPVQVFTSIDFGCTQLDPTVDEVVTVEEYNAVIVPSTGTTQPNQPAVKMPGVGG